MNKKNINFLLGIELLALQTSDVDLLIKPAITSKKTLKRRNIESNKATFINYRFAPNKFHYMNDSYDLRNTDLNVLSHYLEELVPNYKEIDDNIREKIISGYKPDIILESLSKLEFDFHKYLNKFDVSFVSLLDLRWNFCLKLLMIVMSKSMVNVQHGGSYGLFKNNLIEQVERNSASDFLEWNIDDFERKQCLRYRNLPDLSFGVGGVVPHLGPKSTWSKLNSGLYKHLDENDTYGDLYEYSKRENKRFLAHPRGKKEYINNDIYSKIPNILKMSRKDCNVFSYIGSTMLEFCIIYDRPYKIVLEKEIDRDSLTSYGIKFVERLYEDKKVRLLSELG